ncbi:MAG: VTT domain-containing protein [Alphaproteobacteria bacterium]|mgnify:CR=1 FL=1|nr:VTT domain-containing protein [Alphaproteobacteria bacterium]
MNKTPQPPGSSRFSFTRFLPLLLLVAGLVAFFASGLSSYLTLDALKENRETLRALVQAHKAEAVVVFILAYIAVAALSLPVGVVLSVAGGFLFGSVFGAAWIVIGATIGATILFVVAKSALGEPLRQRFASQVKTMEEGFKANAFSYLLLLRLVPLFPFWLVNLAPAFLGVSLSIFVATTFIGIIPGAFVFASIGNGLNALFDAGEQPDLSLLGLLARPDFYIPIAGLAVLSLIPIVYRAVSAKRASNG